MKRELQMKSVPLVSHTSTVKICPESSPCRSRPFKFNPGYDSYQGILKKVSDMELQSPFDSEEPSTESECSSYRNRESGRQFWGAGPYENNSGNGSLYGDESSGSSFAGSDHCPPYEEIHAEVGGGCRYLRRPSSDGNYMNTRTYFSGARNKDADKLKRQSSEYKNSDVVTGRKHREGSDGVYSNCDKGEDGMEDNVTEKVTEAEKHQIETFFRGLRTDLFVSSSLANLYLGWKDVEGKWSFKHTGIPLILLDRGDTKSRSKKRIQIMLAERGTCFPLWKDTIDNLSSYRKAGEAFHTMYLSSDHRQVIGLSFDSSEDSDHFYNYVNELTSNPENINISVPGSKKTKKSSSKKPPPLPHKDQISNPCLFEHVTSVVAKDKSMYMSLQTLLDKEFIKERDHVYCHDSAGKMNGLEDWQRKGPRAYGCGAPDRSPRAFPSVFPKKWSQSASTATLFSARVERWASISKLTLSLEKIVATGNQSPPRHPQRSPSQPSSPAKNAGSPLFGSSLPSAIDSVKNGSPASTTSGTDCSATRYKFGCYESGSSHYCSAPSDDVPHAIRHCLTAVPPSRPASFTARLRHCSPPQHA